MLTTGGVAALLAAYFFAKASGLSNLLGQTPLNSGKFHFDFILSIFLAIHICGVAVLCAAVSGKSTVIESVLFRILSLAKHPAAVSFTLYCLHEPLLYALAALVPYDKHSLSHLALVFLFMLAIIYGLGLLIEPLKRPLYSYMGEKLLK